MRIIDTSNRRALERVFRKDHAADRAFDRRVAAIVGAVRTDGDAALIRFARTFDRATPPLEVSRNEMLTAAATLPAGVRRAIAQAARSIRKVAVRQVPKSFTVTVRPGVAIEQRVE